MSESAIVGSASLPHLKNEGRKYPIVFQNPPLSIIQANISFEDIAMGTILFLTGPLVGAITATGHLRQYRSMSMLSMGVFSSIAGASLSHMLPWARLTGLSPNTQEVAMYGAEEDALYVSAAQNPTFYTTSYALKEARALKKKQLIEDLQSNRESLIAKGMNVDELLSNLTALEGENNETATKSILTIDRNKEASIEDFAAQLRSKASLSEEAEERLSQLIKENKELEKKYK